jgi:hypothetical protein
MPEARDEFFVGYVATPPRLRRFLRRTVVVVLLIAISAAGVIAARQRDPGDGVWDLANQKEFVGRVTMAPYPMLALQQDASTLVLVGVGKVSADVAARFDGRTVRVRGTTLQRANLRMLEVDGGIEPLYAMQPTTKPPVAAASTTTLHGEVIDPKCFAGAMKPGDGKTHKACAALCLRGGIPPALRTRAADGRETVYLIAAADGGAVTAEQLERLIAHVGEHVELTGQIAEHGDLKLLRVTTIP